MKKIIICLMIISIFISCSNKTESNKTESNKTESNKSKVVESMQNDSAKTENNEVRLPKVPEYKAIDGLVFVKGGVMSMGTKNGNATEKPLHKIIIDDFYIGKNEVTLEEYKKFVDDTGYKTDAERIGKSIVYDGSTKFNTIAVKNDVSWKDDEKGEIRKSRDHTYPVIFVSWNDAVNYCNWLSEKQNVKYRLPTEAEWEFAARGGMESKGYKYSGLNNLHRVGWFYSNSKNSPHKIEEEKLPNELGILNMSGNVSEWCNDWYRYDYYRRSPVINPIGPEEGSEHVFRGGSWLDFESKCRVTSRNKSKPTSSSCTIGFRVVREIKI